jgi:hypothetical protein
MANNYPAKVKKGMGNFNRQDTSLSVLENSS